MISDFSSLFVVFFMDIFTQLTFVYKKKKLRFAFLNAKQQQCKMDLMDFFLGGESFHDRLQSGLHDRL